MANISVATPSDALATCNVSINQEALLVQQGRTLYQNQQFAEAAICWEKAVAVLAEGRDLLRQAMASSNLSLTYQQLGRLDEATIAINQSLALLQGVESSKEQLRIRAQTLEIQGRLELVKGESETALETWQQSAKIYDQIGDKDSRIESLINQAQALQALGLYRQAEKTLIEVQKELQEQPDSLNKATALLSLGNTFRVTGKIKESEEVLRESLNIAGSLPSRETEIAASIALGNTVRANKNPQYSLAYYKQADIESATPAMQLQAKLNQLSLLVSNRHWVEVSALQSKIKSELDKLSGRSSVYARINFAQSLMCFASNFGNEKAEFLSPILQQCNFSKEEDKNSIKEKALQLTDVPSWQEIAEIMVGAVKQARQLEDKRAEAYALGYLGGVYQQNEQWGEAQKLTEEALNLTPSFIEADIAYLWQWQLGRIHQAQGDTQSAIAAYTAAFKTLQSLRGDLVAINPDVQFNFRDSVEPVYREWVDLLLRDENPSQKNLKQARVAIEALQLAEIDDFFRQACVDAKPQQIDTVVDRASPPSAVIYSIILKNRVAVILKLPDPTKRPEEQKLLYFSTFKPKKEVESTLKELQIYLRRNPERFQDIKKLSEPVYGWLLPQDFERALQNSGVKILVFVLDGALRNIPMAVLHNGHQYLVEKYAIALTPGLQLLEPRPLAQVSLNGLAAGIGEAVKIEGITQPFAKLNYVKMELEKIPPEVGRDPLFNETFTKANLQNRIDTNNFSVVHLATHGQFSSNPENTYIVVWKDRLQVKDLDNLLRSRDRDRSTPVELLVLSACETADGDERAVLGLAGVAVRAGARSTLATLWQVNDQSTAQLMIEFYQQLKDDPNLTKAEALQRAQLALWKNTKLRWERPYHWAAYVLVGNWL